MFSILLTLSIVAGAAAQEAPELAAAAAAAPAVVPAAAPPSELPPPSTSEGPPATPGEAARNVRVPRANISGIVLMPTAYRGTGRENKVGLGLDFNAAYYIGRIFGKNTLPFTAQKSNFIDRIGQWFLMADGKMQIQTEGPWRPALAFGGLGMFAFRDSPQPSLTASAGTTVTANVDRSDKFGGAYLVATKRLHRKFVTSLGFLQGNVGEMLPLLTEFLTPEALTLATGKANVRATSDSMVFGGLVFQPRPSRVYSIEVMKPQGMLLNPWLFNVNLGSLLHLNFQMSYLTFNGGWDILGMIQFRYSQFPKN